MGIKVTKNVTVTAALDLYPDLKIEFDEDGDLRFCQGTDSVLVARAEIDKFFAAVEAFKEEV